MAFRELMRRLLVADITMGVLLALSYLGIVATGASADPETYVVIQLGAIVVVVNFVLLAAVLYTDWEPV